MTYRVQCTSRDDRDEKTGEPQRWFFDVDSRALADVVIEERP